MSRPDWKQPWRRVSERARAMPPRQRALAWVALALAVLLVAGGVYAWFGHVGKNRITAYFPSTAGIYTGDEVRVLGVKVGSIHSIEPRADDVKVVIDVDSDVPIPRDARAAIIAPSLVSARFIQLAPAYTGGPKLGDGSTIALGHTAVPVEWDDIKTQLAKLSEALGPKENDPQGSLGRFVDTAAANLDSGTGKGLHDALHELSGAISILSDKRTDLFATVRNLQVFVNALADSNTQIVQFGNRLASVSQVLSNSSDELGVALDNLDAALGDVKRFVTDNKAVLLEGVQRLAEVTGDLVRKRPELEQVLHTGPTALQNFYQLYKPAQGSLTGGIAAANFGNPISFLCGSIQGLQQHDSDRTADLCRTQLGPVLQSLALNYPPLLASPATGLNAFPNQLVYSTPQVARQVAAQNQAPRQGSPAAAPVPGPVPQGLASLFPGGGR